MKDYNLSISIYCNTRRKVAWLVKHLRDHNFGAVSVLEINTTDIDDNSEQRFIEANIFVRTDLLGRETQTDDASHLVINYDLPRNIENYLYRAGHRESNSKRNMVISFVTDEEMSTVRRIEQHFSIFLTELPENFTSLLPSINL